MAAGAFGASRLLDDDEAAASAARSLVGPAPGRDRDRAHALRDGGRVRRGDRRPGGPLRRPHRAHRRAHPGPARSPRPDRERVAAPVGHGRARLRRSRRRAAHHHAGAGRVALRRALRAEGPGPRRAQPHALLPRGQPRSAALPRGPPAAGAVGPRDDHPPRRARRDAPHEGPARGPLGPGLLPALRRGQPLHPQAPGSGRRPRSARLPRRLAEHRRRPRGADLHRLRGAGMGPRRLLPRRCA